MAPDLTLLIVIWQRRAAEQIARARELGPTFEGKAARARGEAFAQSADELALALGKDRRPFANLGATSSCPRLTCKNGGATSSCPQNGQER